MNQPQSRFNSDRVCTHTIYNTYLLYDYIYFLPGRPTVCPTDYIYIYKSNYSRSTWSLYNVRRYISCMLICRDEHSLASHTVTYWNVFIINICMYEVEGKKLADTKSVFLTQCLQKKRENSMKAPYCQCQWRALSRSTLHLFGLTAERAPAVEITGR